MVPVFAALSAALFVLFVLAALSLLLTGGILDWSLLARFPPWVAWEFSPDVRAIFDDFGYGRRDFV